MGNIIIEITGVCTTHTHTEIEREREKDTIIFMQQNTHRDTVSAQALAHAKQAR